MNGSLQFFQFSDNMTFLISLQIYNKLQILFVMHLSRPIQTYIDSANFRHTFTDRCQQATKMLIVVRYFVHRLVITLFHNDN